jgi:hypothetical protein
MLERIVNIPRWILAGLSSSALIILMAYSAIEGSKLENEKINLLNHPLEHLQEEIRLGFLKIGEVNGYEITGHDSQRKYQLTSDPSMNIRKGETYSFIGMITASGKIRIAILIVLYLIIKNIRIQEKGRYLTVINEDKFDA